jgi:hypothetical protein
MATRREWLVLPRYFKRPEPRHTAFLAGLVISFMACTLMGKYAASHNIFENFGRFHHALAPDTLYLPTARQVRQLAIETLDKSKVNVVLGGSSVFYGVGQPPGSTIADYLRQELGESFRVINLAMRGGDASGIAEMAAEMLLRDGYRVIHVTDVASAGHIQPIGSAPYQYFYWQAKALGLLLDWPRRDAVVKKRTWADDSQLGTELDKFLYFNETWNWVSYVAFSTVSPRSQLLRPRRIFRDPDVDPPQEFRYRNTEVELKLIQHLAELPSPETWEVIRRAAEIALPEPIRKLTLITVCENSGWLLDQVAKQARDNRRIMRERTVATMVDLGLSSFSSCDNFDRDDYVDRVHLSSTGAKRIAPRLAEKVRDIARAQGWMAP